MMVYPFRAEPPCCKNFAPLARSLTLFVWRCHSSAMVGELSGRRSMKSQSRISETSVNRPLQHQYLTKKTVPRHDLDRLAISTYGRRCTGPVGTRLDRCRSNHG